MPEIRRVVVPLRPEFIKAIDEAAEAGTFVDVRVVAPYTNITKGQIAEIRSEERRVGKEC